MSNVKISAIAAMAENRVIGNQGKIPWHISADFKHFKTVTMGKPVIMGRKTFESLPGVLPGRPHIIVSRSEPAPSPEIAEISSPSNLHYVKSIEEGVSLSQELASQDGQDEIFIIGGGEIYAQSMDLLDRLYLTIVHHQYEGDAHFPEFHGEDWVTANEEHHAKTGTQPAFTFLVLERKNYV